MVRQVESFKKKGYPYPPAAKSNRQRLAYPAGRNVRIVRTAVYACGRFKSFSSQRFRRDVRNVRMKSFSPAHKNEKKKNCTYPRCHNYFSLFFPLMFFK
jgi:hypothetical protein